MGTINLWVDPQVRYDHHLARIWELRAEKFPRTWDGPRSATTNVALPYLAPFHCRTHHRGVVLALERFLEDR